MPLTINCWPEAEGGGQMNVSMEYELVRLIAAADQRGMHGISCSTFVGPSYLGTVLKEPPRKGLGKYGVGKRSIALAFISGTTVRRLRHNRAAPPFFRASFQLFERGLQMVTSSNSPPPKLPAPRPRACLMGWDGIRFGLWSSTTCA